jgi:hypothetical protein
VLQVELLILYVHLSLLSRCVGSSLTKGTQSSFHDSSTQKPQNIEAKGGTGTRVRVRIGQVSGGRSILYVRKRLLFHQGGRLEMWGNQVPQAFLLTLVLVLVLSCLNPVMGRQEWMYRHASEDSARDLMMISDSEDDMSLTNVSM